MGVLTFTAASALAIMAVEHERETSKLMGVLGKVAREGVAYVGKNGAALLASAVDGAEEIAGVHVLSWTRGCRKHLGWLLR